MLLPSNEAAASLPQDLQLPVGCWVWGAAGCEPWRDQSLFCSLHWCISNAQQFLLH